MCTWDYIQIYEKNWNVMLKLEQREIYIYIAVHIYTHQWTQLNSGDSNIIL